MPVYGFPDRRSYDNVSKAAQRVNNRLGKRVGAMRVKEGVGGSDQAAIADGSIAPGATASVFLADESFVATATTKDATNDSGVTIPTGTKLYIGKVKPLPGLRIKQAFICEDPAP